MTPKRESNEEEGRSGTSMRDSERMLLGKLEEFHEWSKHEFLFLRADLSAQRLEIDKLIKLKWQVYAIATLLGAVPSILAMVFKIVYIQK